MWYWKAYVLRPKRKACAGHVGRVDSCTAPEGIVKVSLCHCANFGADPSGPPGGRAARNACKAGPTTGSTSAAAMNSCGCQPNSSPSADASPPTSPRGRAVCAGSRGSLETSPPNVRAMSCAPRQMPSTGLSALLKSRTSVSTCSMSLGGYWSSVSDELVRTPSGEPNRTKQSWPCDVRGKDGTTRTLGDGGPDTSRSTASCIANSSTCAQASCMTSPSIPKTSSPDGLTTKTRVPI
mmetsp:Transcript_114860/g.359268  ORF Transcript_114860/g.359268 Transcript_114860/m.359268 type:complete len:237 (-) Transcript_114860:70-780(-)